MASAFHCRLHGCWLLHQPAQSGVSQTILAADYNHQYAYVADIRFRDRERIAAQRGKIGELAGSSEPFLSSSNIR
jgi:hypothetical protein